MRRAVITGIGIVSSLGNNKDEVLESLRNGKSGIEFVQDFADVGMRSQVAGTIKNFSPADLIDRKALRFMSDSSIYAFVAMQQAIADAKLTELEVSNLRTGLVAGAGGGSSVAQYAATEAVKSPRGVKAVGPYAVTKTMCSGVSACLATAFKIKGLSYSISSACATSSHCIINAVEQIKLGNQDIVFAGGGEELSWELASMFDAMGALSIKYNDSTASRAYDESRDGFVIAGGGGMVVVEELEHALKRGAKIYAEIVGYGATSDGYDMVAPSGEGAERCMKLALATLPAHEKVDYINTHGTSTPVGDVKEAGAIKAVFTDYSPAISSTKSLSGHSLGAAGVHEAIYSLLMMENNFITASAHLTNLDPQLPELDIVRTPRSQELNVVMSNSFGFGGTNATLLLKKYTV